MKNNTVQPRSRASRLAALACACAVTAAAALFGADSWAVRADAVQEQTLTGYITTEDDWAADLKEDTADMINMKMMALSGLGITFEQDGKWVFYYFDGTFATNNKAGTDGKWAFDGTGSQLAAWNLVGEQVRAGNGKDPAQVTVKGYFAGDTATNTGLDADGISVSVLTVTAFNGVATGNRLPEADASAALSSSQAGTVSSSASSVSSAASSAGSAGTSSVISQVSQPATGYAASPFAALALAGCGAAAAGFAGWKWRAHKK